ncbi:hypothetical protein pdam_00013753, partial [Pocillopora damicornis]
MIGAQDKEKIKLGIKCSIVLLPLLGITWVFGVLAFDQATVVFLYLFAIFNSLQFARFDKCQRGTNEENGGKDGEVSDDDMERKTSTSGPRFRYCSLLQGSIFSPSNQLKTPFDVMSKPVSCSLTTERLPSHGVRMTDLRIKENNQNYRRSGEMNGNFT